MKKPTLRLRQVFEHGTHFKVQRPSGDTITIAKKGLGPGMTGRLRKFAVGGEATGIIEEPTAVPVVVPPPAPSVAPAGFTQEEEVEIEKFLAQPPLPALPKEAPVPPAAAPAVTAPAVAPVTAPASVTAAPAVAADQALDLITKPFTPKQRAQETLDAAKVALSGLNQMPEPATEQEKIRLGAERALATETVRAEEQKVAELERAEILKQEGDRLQKEVEAVNAKIAKNQETIEKAERDLADMQNAGSYFARMDTVQKIGTAVSLALGAIGAGLAGGPNQALKMYENAIERDLEKQKRDQQSLFNKMVRAGNSIEQSENLVRTLGARVMANKLDAAAATVASTKARDGLAALSFDIRSRANDSIERMRQSEINNKRADAALRVQQGDLALRQSADKRRDIELALEAAKLGQKQTEIDSAKLKDEQQLAEKERERTFIVDGVKLIAANPAEQRKANEQILGQRDFISGAKNALSIIEKNPYRSFVKFTKENSTLRLALRQMLERYPKSERFGRPLNLTASRVIKEGVPDADQVINGVFGDPQEVLRDLINDTIEQRVRAIETYGGNSSPESVKAAVAAARMGQPIKTLATTP
jgi:hypothetical protein